MFKISLTSSTSLDTELPRVSVRLFGNPHELTQSARRRGNFVLRIYVRQHTVSGSPLARNVIGWLPGEVHGSIKQA
ncbi:MAG: hypothetical protein ACRD5Z_15675 [Bryobacteraceae bacterium]